MILGLDGIFKILLSERCTALNVVYNGNIRCHFAARDLGGFRGWR